MGRGVNVGERSDDDCSFRVKVVGTPDCSQKAGLSWSKDTVSWRPLMSTT